MAPTPPRPRPPPPPRRARPPGVAATATLGRPPSSGATRPALRSGEGGSSGFVHSSFRMPWCHPPQTSRSDRRRPRTSASVVLRAPRAACVGPLWFLTVRVSTDPCSTSPQGRHGHLNLCLPPGAPQGGRRVAHAAPPGGRRGRPPVSARQGPPIRSARRGRALSCDDGCFARGTPKPCVAQQARLRRLPSHPRRVASQQHPPPPRRLPRFGLCTAWRSNDRVRAAEHRVSAAPVPASGGPPPRRLSAVLFLGAWPRAEVTCAVWAAPRPGPSGPPQRQLLCR